jgi:RNA polymerase-interacting CarD/CdnL/TRCF family regulator
MNQTQMKNYASDLNELLKTGQLLEYARLVAELYAGYDTSVVMDVMEHFCFLNGEEF